MISYSGLKKLALWGVPSLIFLLIATTLFQSDYRVGASGVYRLERGTIVLTVPDPSSTILLDDRAVATTAEPLEEVVLEDIQVGEHRLIVSLPGTWPWQKAVEVSAEATTTDIAFVTLTPAVVTTIDENHEEYTDAREAFQNHRVPTATSALQSSDARSIIWTDLRANTLHAKWNEPDAPFDFCSGGAHDNCPDEIVFFRPRHQIQSFTYYRGRSDVAILAAGTEVFALDLVAEQSNQNFHPIYSGRAPRVIARDPQSIYIEDAGQFLIAEF